jgi:hypothetical protein
VFKGTGHMKRPHPSTDIDDCDQQSRDISVRQGVVDLRWFPSSWAGDQPVFNTPELFNLAGPERFELPTAGFEDQNSSTELRTEMSTFKYRKMPIFF